MNAFELAYKIWGGTIAICCGFMVFFGILAGDAISFMMGIIGFFLSVLITFPLLWVTKLLIQLACQIPYNHTVKLYWLGFMLLALNFLFFKLLHVADSFIAAEDILDGCFIASSCTLMFILVFRRTVIKNFFFQQTRNKNL